MLISNSLSSHLRETMNNQTWLWFVYLISAMLAVRANAAASTQLRVFPLRGGLLVYLDSVLNGSQKYFTLQYPDETKYTDDRSSGAVFRHYDTQRLIKLCAVKYLYTNLTACIDQEQVINKLSIGKVPVQLKLYSKDSKLVSSWNAPDRTVRTYSVFWIHNDIVTFHELLNHTKTSSVLNDYNECEKYTFALYGHLSNGSWVHMGDQSYHSELNYRSLTNLQAYPYKENYTVLTWDWSMNCLSAMAEIVVTTKDNEFTTEVDLNSWDTVEYLPLIGATFNATVVFANDHNQRVITKISRTFLNSTDDKVEFTSNSFDKRTLFVSWTQNTTNTAHRLLVWHADGKLRVQPVLPNVTSAEQWIADLCKRYELSVMDCYVSNKCAIAGEFAPTAHKTTLQRSDAYPIGSDLYLHWEQSTHCPVDEQIVTVEVDGKTSRAILSYHKQLHYFPGDGRPGTVKISMRPLYSPHRSNIFVRSYKFEHRQNLFKVKSINYKADRIIVKPEFTLLTPTELSIIWISESTEIFMEKRSSTDQSPLILYRQPCMKYQLGILQSIGIDRRIYIGGVIVEAGRPKTEHVTIKGDEALIQYIVDAPCKPHYLNASVQHTSGVEPVVKFITDAFVRLTNLKPCIQYNFQLIAVYLPKYSTVSKETYITLPPALDENKAFLTIKRDQLAIRWKPRASCQLQKTVTTVWKDGIEWKRIESPPNITTLTLPLLKTYSMYTVAIAFMYANGLTESSEIDAIYHEPEIHSPLVISTQVNPHNVQLHWKTTEEPAALYYRIDGIYNTELTFSMIVAHQACTVPLQNSTEYLNVIVYEMSAVSGGMGRSVHHTIWPQKVPQKPFPPVIERGTKGIVVSWTLVEADPVEKIHITIKLGQHETVEQVVSPTQHGKHTVQNADCLNAVCSFSLRAVNEYGEGPASDSVAFL